MLAADNSDDEGLMKHCDTNELHYLTGVKAMEHVIIVEWLKW
jgi:hypothetical protein